MTLLIPLVDNRYSTLLSVHVPTLPSDFDFVNQWRRLCTGPKSDKIFPLGDFNGRVGQYSGVWKGVLGKHGVGQGNSNGMRLPTLCSEHNLIVATNGVGEESIKTYRYV